MRKPTAKGDDEKREEFEDSGGNSKGDDEEDPAQANDAEAERGGDTGFNVSQAGLYRFSPEGSDTSPQASLGDASSGNASLPLLKANHPVVDASNSAPPLPVEASVNHDASHLRPSSDQIDASTMSSNVPTLPVVEPLTLDSAILPPADASFSGSNDACNFPNSLIFPETLGGSTFSGDAAFSQDLYSDLSLSQAIEEAIRDFSDFHPPASASHDASHGGSTSDGWIFPDITAPSMTNPPVSADRSTCASEFPPQNSQALNGLPSAAATGTSASGASTQTHASVTPATIPSVVSLSNADTADTGSIRAAAPVSAIGGQKLPASATDVDGAAHSSRRLKRKNSPSQPTSIQVGAPVAAVQQPESSQVLQADSAKRLRKKSTRNEVANAIGTNAPAFLGKENIPPDSEAGGSVGQKRKHAATNDSPNKRYVAARSPVSLSLTCT